MGRNYIWVDDLVKNNCEFIVYHDDSLTEVEVEKVRVTICDVVDNMLDNGDNHWDVEDI